ncbi:MAG: FG-GAP-like repeat-containing protein [Thermoplasmatota archaeon]
MRPRNSSGIYRVLPPVLLLLACSLLQTPAGGGKVEAFSSGKSEVELDFPPGGGELTVHVKLPGGSNALSASLSIRGERVPNEKSIFHTTDADFSTGQLVNATLGLDSVQRETHLPFLSPMRAHASGRAPHYIAVGDVNGDGRRDVVVTNYYSNSTGVYLQGSDGSLGTMTSYEVGAFPNGVAVGDLSGDGREDIAVAAVRLDATGYVALFNQTSTGGVGPRAELPAGLLPDGIAIGDVSSDGLPDIVVTNWAEGSVGVFQQRQGGGFYQMVPYSVGANPRGVAIGDVNGDGRSDIVVAVTGENKTGVLYQASDGQLQLPVVKLDAGLLPVGVAVGDLDSNGRVDIAVANSRSNDTGVYFQKPDGTLTAVFRYHGSDAQPWMVAVGDLNDDDRADLAVSNHFPGADVVDTIAQDILDLLKPLQNLPSGALPDGVAIGDVTGDGLDDLVVANRGDDTIGVYEQRRFTALYTSAPVIAPFGIVSAWATWSERPRGAPVSVALSNDNGAHWTQAVNGSEVVFGEAGTRLLYRVEFTSATALTDILVNYTLETLYPTDVSVDVGGDGSIEWERAGPLTGKETLPDLSAAISAYLASHPLDVDPEGNISVPLRVWSRTAGVLVLSGLSVEYNIPPSIKEYMPRDSPVVLSEGQVARFSVNASDRDGDPLSYSWELDGESASGGAPQFNYSADYRSSGNHTITAFVTDGLATASHTWELRVRNVNRPPELSGLTPEGPPDMREGEAVSFEATAGDPDGDNVTVEWLLDGALVARAAAGRSSYEYRAWFTDAGEHNLTVTATDGELRALHSWAFSVADVNPLTDLSLTSPASDVVIREGEEQRFSADEGALSALLGNISLRWTYDLEVVSTGPEFILYSDYSSSGNHSLTLTLSAGGAGGLRLVRVWRVAIEEVTDPPVIQSYFPTGDPIIREGSELEFRVSATDPDNDTLSISWRLNGTEVSTGASYVFKAGYDSEGTYNVTVLVSDGRVELSQSWALTVLHGSRPAPAGEGQGVLIGAVAAAAVLAAVGAGLVYAWRRRERVSSALDMLESGGAAPEAAQPVGEAPEEPEAPAPKKKATYPCPSCGKEAEEDWFLCHHCSARLKDTELAVGAAGATALEAEATEDAMRRAARRVEAPECPSCGKAVSLSDERCPACGEALRAAPQALLCCGCGKPVEADWVRCPECGAQLAPEASPARPKCPGCGLETEPGWVKCPECGAELARPPGAQGDGGS